MLRVEGNELVLEHAREFVRIVFEGPESLPRSIIVDLSGVGYVNSSGISVLIRLNVERQMVIAGLTVKSKEILDLAGVLPFLTLASDVEEAQAKLRGE